MRGAGAFLPKCHGLIFFDALRNEKPAKSTAVGITLAAQKSARAKTVVESENYANMTRAMNGHIPVVESR